jgi:hypothetical protein
MDPAKEASQPRASLYSLIALPAYPPDSIASTVCRNLVIEQRQDSERHQALLRVIEIHARTLIERLGLPGANPVEALQSVTEESSPLQISPSSIIERALALPEGIPYQRTLQRLTLSQSPGAACTAILVLSNKASFAAQSNMSGIKAMVSQLSRAELRNMLFLAADQDQRYRFGDFYLFDSDGIRSLLDCQSPDNLIAVLEELHHDRQQMLASKTHSAGVERDQIWAPALAWAITLSPRDSGSLDRIAQLYQLGDILTTRAAIADAAIQNGVALTQLYKQEIERPVGNDSRIERGVQALKHLAIEQRMASLEFVTSALTSTVPQYAFQAVHLLCQEKLFGAAGREIVVEVAWSLIENNLPNPVLGTLFWTASSTSEKANHYPTYKALVEFLARKPLDRLELIENLSKTPLHLPSDTHAYSDILKRDSLYMQLENISLNTLLARYFPVQTALDLSAAGGILGRNAEMIFSLHCERLPKNTANQLQRVMTYPALYPESYRSILRIAGIPSSSSETGP